MRVHWEGDLLQEARCGGERSMSPMNRLDRRVVSVLLLAGIFVLSSSSCGGSSAKSSSATKHSVPRDLYIINAKTGAIDQDFPDVNYEEGAVLPAVSDGNGGWFIDNAYPCS